MAVRTIESPKERHKSIRKIIGQFAVLYVEKLFSTKRVIKNQNFKETGKGALMKEECLSHPTIQKTVLFPYTFLIFVFSHLLWVYTYILFIFTLQSQSCSSSSAFYPFPLIDKPTNKDFALRKTFYCDSSESASGKKNLKTKSPTKSHNT